MPRFPVVLLPFVLLATVLAAGALWHLGDLRAQRGVQTISIDKVELGGPFTLTDQDGKKRSDSEFRGKLMIVYFGYTYCPDICPTDLMAITQALEALGPAADGVQPVFITIDPERDTKVLAEYVSAFHPSMIGLTGSPADIRKVANSYKAFYTKVSDERTGAYSIDHSGVIYLMGRNGEYLGFVPPQTGPERLTEVLRTHLSR